MCAGVYICLKQRCRLQGASQRGFRFHPRRTHRGLIFGPELPSHSYELVWSDTRNLVELFNAGRDAKRLYAKMDCRFKWEHFTHITSFNLADSYSLHTPPLFQSTFSKPFSSFLLPYTTDCAQALPNPSSYICCFVLRFHLQTSCQPLTSLFRV